jgi:hypothetical protein
VLHALRCSHLVEEETERLVEQTRLICCW